ncbi:MAG: TIGR00180 family glycosyltransferase [Pontiellaceae bacterium]|nr:TIGR00180 family glycosyltransferase [Pontiellaceae bacterium]
MMIDTPRDKITVLVNVHNRHERLSRQLDYIHQHYDHILVLDSSDVEYTGKHDYPNVEYFYYPRWEYVDKLADVIKKVKTPYAHLCADDDFYVPSAIYSCVSFLEKHEDYVCAHGRYIAFYWDGKHFDMQPLYTHYIGRDICCDDVEQRLYDSFNPYIQLLYGVHRSATLQECFVQASIKQVLNHRLVELLVTALSAVNGKHKVLPLLYGARETLYDSAGTFIPTINEVLVQDSVKGEYTRFLDIVTGSMEKTCGIVSAKGEQIFRSAFMPYLSVSGSKLKQLPRCLPPYMRIIINRLRYGNSVRDSLGMDHRGELNTIETFVRKHDC